MKKTRTIWVDAEVVNRVAFTMEVPLNASWDRVQQLAQEEAEGRLAEEDGDIEVVWKNQTPIKP